MTRGESVAYAAALWALIFAIFHFVWAAGWYPLLSEGAQEAFAVPWKWTFNFLIAWMCAIAVPVVLATVMPWGHRSPRRLVHAILITGTTLVVLRAVASVIQVGYFVATGQFRLSVLGVWEPWFYLGAILFSLSTWRAVRWRE